MWEIWERVLQLRYSAATCHIGERTNERTVHVVYRDQKKDVSLVIMKGKESDMHTSVLTVTGIPVTKYHTIAGTLREV